MAEPASPAMAPGSHAWRSPNGPGNGSTRSRGIMKLLFVTGTLPYPPTDGWKIRVFALLRGLAQRHAVSVVSFVRRIDDALAVERLRDQGIDLHVVCRDHRYAPSKLFQGLVGRTAFPILNYRDER